MTATVPDDPAGPFDTFHVCRLALNVWKNEQFEGGGVLLERGLDVTCEIRNSLVRLSEGATPVRQDPVVRRMPCHAQGPTGTCDRHNVQQQDVNFLANDEVGFRPNLKEQQLLQSLSDI